MFNSCFRRSLWIRLSKSPSVGRSRRSEIEDSLNTRSTIRLDRWCFDCVFQCGTYALIHTEVRLLNNVSQVVVAEESQTAEGLENHSTVCRRSDRRTPKGRRCWSTRTGQHIVRSFEPKSNLRSNVRKRTYWLDFCRSRSTSATPNCATSCWTSCWPVVTLLHNCSRYVTTLLPAKTSVFRRR